MNVEHFIGHLRAALARRLNPRAPGYEAGLHRLPETAEAVFADESSTFISRRACPPEA